MRAFRFQLSQCPQDLGVKCPFYAWNQNGSMKCTKPSRILHTTLPTILKYQGDGCNVIPSKASFPSFLFQTHGLI